MSFFLAYRQFSSQKMFHGIVNMGGVVKTLRCNSSLYLASPQRFWYRWVLWVWDAQIAFLGKMKLICGAAMRHW